MVREGSLRVHNSPPPVLVLSKGPVQSPRPFDMFRNIQRFYGEELLVLYPATKLEDHPLSAVLYFIVFAVTFHNWRPFVYPQPDDAPCRGDRDPLITEHIQI